MPVLRVNWVLFFLTGLLGMGCDPAPKTDVPEYIIRAGPVLVTRT